MIQARIRGAGVDSSSTADARASTFRKDVETNNPASATPVNVIHKLVAVRSDPSRASKANANRWTGASPAARFLASTPGQECSAPSKVNRTMTCGDSSALAPGKPSAAVVAATMERKHSSE